MRWIDDRGRLAGRINIIDAALVACVLALLPIGYTAVRLFRLPPPIIMTVEPAEQIVGPDLHIRLHGRNFRPVLRPLFGRTNAPFSLGGVPGAVNVYAAVTGRFVVETPTDVEIALPKLLPGQYDVHLYDQTREVAKRVGAFVLRSPSYQDSWARLHVQFLVVPFDPSGIVRPGDVDVSRETEADSEVGAPDTRSAVLRSVGASVKSSAIMEGGGPLYSVEGDVDVPVRQVTDRLWRYKRQVVRRGNDFRFETTRYMMRGIVIDMTESKTN